jgi:hypothetical protein
MKDTMLKKSFDSNDLSRIRNLISGNVDGTTKTLFGYSNNKIDRNESEIFEENGKKWIIENGIKRSYSRLNSLKISLKSPLLCPGCGKPMNSYDSKMFKINGSCMDCTSSNESLLKINGGFEEYKNKIFSKNIDFFIDEAIEYIKDEIDSSDMFVTEEGDVEDWGGGEEYRLEYLNNTLKELEEFKISRSSI